MQERIKYGMDFNTALKIACKLGEFQVTSFNLPTGFQFVYTTIFGMYSAYLLFRTGHFSSTFIVHAFCNHMGFPDLVEVTTYKRNKKIVIVCLFFVGFVSWCFLLNPLTEPSWYYNSFQWYKIWQIRDNLVISESGLVNILQVLYNARKIVKYWMTYYSASISVAFFKKSVKRL